MKKLIFTILAVMCCMAMNAQSTFEVDGIKYSVTGENTVEVIANYPIYSRDIVIPSTVTYSNTTYNVTGIGDYAFRLCDAMSSVTIPESVNSIGTEAFSNCYGLTSVTIPESVTSIGNRAFYFCSNLASATIPKSVKSIEAGAFAECESLTSITIPENVTSIGTDAFVNCKGLASITVAEENTEYESPDNCNAIIEKSTHTLLWGCKNTVIPNTVTSINNNAFRMHTGLTSITIPESVTSIGDAAFQSTGLTSVIIGKSVKTIGDGAFRNCTYMTEIDVLATTPPTLGTDAFDLVAKDIPVYVPDVDAYKKTSWGEFTNLIKYVDLPTAKKEAIDDLKTFIKEEKIANAPIKEYADCINAATAKKDIPSIVNNIKAKINNYTKFTLGECKYLLDKNDEKYTIVGGSLTFTDKELYQSGNDFTVDGTLTLTRDVSPVIGKWQAWFVPFDLTLTSDDLAKFDAAQVAGVLTDNDGQPVIAFKKMKEGEKMNANIPYVIRPKSGIVQEISRHLFNPKFHSSATTPFVIQSAYDNFTLGGIYEAQQNSNWYALTKDGVFKKMNGTPAPTLQPQRIWMTVTPREDDPYATKSVSTTRSIGTKSTAIPDVIRIVVLGDDGSPEGKPVREAKIINADGQSVNRIQRGQVYRISGNVNE